MRITRSKLRQTYKNKSFGLTVAFTIILPMISIYLGYTAFKLFIIPGMQTKEMSKQSIGVTSEEKISQKQNNTKTEPVQEEAQEAFVTTFELESVNFYSIQIGKFTTMENAETLRTDLAMKGYEGYIYQEDGFKVIAISLLNRSGIDHELQKIRKAYPDAYVTTMSVPAQLIKYTKNDSKNTLTIEQQNKRIMDVFLKLSGNVEQLSREDTDVERIKMLADENLKEIESIKNELKNIKSSTNIERVARDLIKVTDVATIYLVEGKEAGTVSKVQRALNESLYEYVVFSKNSQY